MLGAGSCLEHSSPWLLARPEDSLLVQQEVMGRESALAAAKLSVLSEVMLMVT